MRVTGYIVICTSSVSEGGRGTYEQATRRVFATYAEAAQYSLGISPTRGPLIVPLEQPRCGSCKHWARVESRGWNAPTPTGIPVGDRSFHEDGPGPTTLHGRCGRIRHTHRSPERHKLVRRSDEELSREPAVVCDSDDYSAWICTLASFGCVLHETRNEVHLPIVEGD
jgi:hypothetical protein